MLNRRSQSKASVSQKWEQLRQKLVAKGQTYDQQLAVEQRGDGFGFHEVIRKFEANLIPGQHDFWDFMAATGPLMYRRYWRKLRAEPPDWEGVFKFFGSAYFSELPQPFITSRLTAELLTGNEPISTGDPMDVDLLAIALPVAHFVLTDHRMELRTKKLGLDSKCGTAVYSMSTSEELFARLENL